MKDKKQLGLAAADAIENEFNAAIEVKATEEVWREDPLPLIDFVRSPDHLSGGGALDLYPEQRADLEAFLSTAQDMPSYVDKRGQMDGDRYSESDFPGTDPKMLFDANVVPKYNQAFLIWGKGCLGADERLHDLLSGCTKTVKEWAELGCPLLLHSWDGEKVVERPASPVYLKGNATVYRISLSDGRSFVATGEHRCLATEGWLPVDSFQVGHTQLLTIPHGSNAQKSGSPMCSLADEEEQNPFAESGDRTSEQKLESPLECLTHPNSTPQQLSPFACCLPQTSLSSLSHKSSLTSREKNGAYGNQTVPSFQFGCHPFSHFCDEQPRGVAGAALNVSPSLSDAPLRSLRDPHRDVSREELSPECIPTCPRFSPQQEDTCHEADHGGASFHLPFSCAVAAFRHCSHISLLARDESFLRDNQRLPQVTSRHQTAELPYINSLRYPHSFPIVTAVEIIGDRDYYDLTVAETHCYFDAQGILHHNSGKDTSVSFFQCWIAHILLCLNDPQKYLCLPPGESIDIPVIGYSENQAKTVYFEKFKTRLKSWKWLRRTIEDLTGIDGDRYLREGGEYVHTYDVELPHKIKCWSLNSSLGNSEGKNILAYTIDEVSAFTSPVKKNLAREIHNLLVSSARSRFEHRWRGFAITFPRHKEDHAMTIARQVAAGEISDTYVSIKPTWVVRPDRTKDSFKADFERDPEDADTKYGCNPPAAVDAYFRSPELLLRNASGAPIELLKQYLVDVAEEQLGAIASRGRNPIVEITASGDPVLDGRGFPKLSRWFRPQKDGLGRPYEYYVHLDPGLSGDAFGFAMGHNHVMQNGAVLPTIDLSFRWTGFMFEGFGTIQRMQFFPDEPATTEIVEAAEVDFRTVREFIYYLKFAKDFNLVQVSYDSWNSAESRQHLERKGIQTFLRVVCKQDYDELKNLAYNRQLRYYAHPVLIEELFKLQLVNATKVDAPRTKEGEGSRNDSHKDIADAVAAVARYLNFYRGDTSELFQFDDVQDPNSLATATKEASLVLGDRALSEAQSLLFQKFLAD